MVFDLFILFAGQGFSLPPKTNFIHKLFSGSGKRELHFADRKRHSAGKTGNKNIHLKQVFKKMSQKSKLHVGKYETLRAEMEKAISILQTQPPRVFLEGNTAVIGDIHGDYKNLDRIISYIDPMFKSGEIQNILFLGDYIDRGPDSSRTLYTLLKLFNENPGRVFLLRGNHETIDNYLTMSGKNAARNEEIIRDLSKDLLFDFFAELPYVAVINGETLATHGGIPRKDLWSDFWICEKEEEFGERFSVIYSTMWADYDESGDAETMNRRRGRNCLAVCYNEECVEDFFGVANIMLPEIHLGREFNLKYIIRGHQPSLGTFHQSPNKIVTTVFSAVKGQGLSEPDRRACIAILKSGKAPELLKKI